MRWPKLHRGQLIVVHWLDIKDISEWQSQREAANTEPAKCRSVGWYLGRNQHKINLMPTMSDDRYCSVVTFPVGCITRVEVKGT
jgi:hypothetical protein